MPVQERSGEAFTDTESHIMTQTLLLGAGEVAKDYIALWNTGVSTWWVFATQPTSVPYISLDDLLVIAFFPILIFGIASFVVESVFGGRESTAAGVGGAILVGLAVIVPADLNRAVAIALWREFGWRIGFEVTRPVAVYWGILGALFLLGALEERQESTTD